MLDTRREPLGELGTDPGLLLVPLLLHGEHITGRAAVSTRGSWAGTPAVPLAYLALLKPSHDTRER